jgi:sec-independent protein translocase protein TatC
MDTDQPTRGEMSFGDHLEELRRRLFIAAVVPLPLAIVLFFFADTIRNILVAPALTALQANGLPAQLQALGPAEVLTTNLKLSIITAIVFSTPWIIWQAWKFIEPGLFSHERRFVHFLIPGSIVLTISGLALLYWVMLPLMLRVLIAFGVPDPAVLTTLSPEDTSTRIEVAIEAGHPVIPILTEAPTNPAPGQVWVDSERRSLMIVMPTPGSTDGHYELGSIAVNREGTIAQEFRLAEYINFVLLLMLAISIAFQMPLAIVLLGWMGLAEREFLERNRRYALLLCAVLGAILTPADIVSMVLLFVPLYLLYELGIILLRIAPADRVAAGTMFKRTANAPRPDDDVDDVDNDDES